MATQSIAEQEFLQRLKTFIAAKFGSQSKAADHYGMSRQFMSLILKGKSATPPSILEDIGYARSKVVVYDLIEDSKAARQ